MNTAEARFKPNHLQKTTVSRKNNRAKEVRHLTKNHIAYHHLPQNNKNENRLRLLNPVMHIMRPLGQVNSNKATHQRQKKLSRFKIPQKIIMQTKQITVHNGKTKT